MLEKGNIVHQGPFPSRQALPDSVGQRGFRSLRVLIADDSRVERKVVTSILERRGHRVTAAADGSEALTLFHQGSFDAAVLDLQMPGIDGEALAALFRERLRSLESEAAPAFRIIAVSGNAPEDNAWRDGMDGYLTKPIDPDRLAAAVEGTADADPASPEHGGDEETELGERVVFDLGEALSRARGKHHLLAELVRIFLEDASVQMLALRSALDASDLERIERSAHRLKGSAMNVSAQLTADVAKKIEQRARSRQVVAARTLWKKLEVEVSRARKALAGFLVQNGGAEGGVAYGVEKRPLASNGSPVSP